MKNNTTNHCWVIEGVILIFNIQKEDDLYPCRRAVNCSREFRNNLPFSLRQGPHFVAVNNKNEIIVTDFHNHSVKVRLAALCCSLVVDSGGCNFSFLLFFVQSVTDSVLMS